jgi:hypothetical protein
LLYLHAIFKSMIKQFLFIFCCFSLFTTKAQIHEVGVFAGMSNYMGDIGRTTYFYPNRTAFGAIYKWNKSPRHAWRASYIQSTINGGDDKSDTANRRARGYSFDNNIKELSLGLEFNFFDFNLFDYKRKVTPYIYSGVSLINYQELYFDKNATSKKYKIASDEYGLAIPMVVGMKYNIGEHLNLAGEVGVRYALTDNLDGSNPSNKNLAPNRFGDLNSNDWYVFSGITLTYTFGIIPCYCAE